MGPEFRQVVIPASLFLFLNSGNYSRGGKNGSLSSGSTQSNLRFAHPQVRLKQQLLRSKDGNGNCLCRDSDAESPVSPPESRTIPTLRLTWPRAAFAQAGSGLAQLRLRSAQACPPSASQSRPISPETVSF
jgi:hypothetical protein